MSTQAAINPDETATPADDNSQEAESEPNVGVEKNQLKASDATCDEVYSQSSNIVIRNEEWKTKDEYDGTGVDIAYVVVCNVSIDEKSIRRLLVKLGYKLAGNKIHNKVSKDDESISAFYMKVLMTSIRMANFDKCRSILFLLICHGDKDFVILSDRYFSADLIASQVAKNKSLLGKPKWIVFASCQGTKHMPTLTNDEDSNMEAFAGLVRKPPLFQDMLITYGSFPGYTAQADQEYGCIMLRHLEEVVTHMAPRCHTSLQNVLTKLLACSSWKWCNPRPNESPNTIMYENHALPTYLSTMGLLFPLNLSIEANDCDLGIDDPAEKLFKNVLLVLAEFGMVNNQGKVSNKRAQDFGDKLVIGFLDSKYGKNNSGGTFLSPIYRQLPKEQTSKLKLEGIHRLQEAIKEFFGCRNIAMECVSEAFECLEYLVLRDIDPTVEENTRKMEHLKLKP